MNKKKQFPILKINKLHLPINLYCVCPFIKDICDGFHRHRYT